MVCRFLAVKYASVNFYHYVNFLNVPKLEWWISFLWWGCCYFGDTTAFSKEVLMNPCFQRIQWQNPWISFILTTILNFRCTGNELCDYVTTGRYLTVQFTSDDGEENRRGFEGIVAAVYPKNPGKHLHILELRIDKTKSRTECQTSSSTFKEIECYIHVIRSTSV